ncbi:acyltransferase [uncultured Draconibacterium sp.]|uniref:acyltransferase n=1 Tax=uncultured Draconibacterium sp. TaxID=1573823 RepID=UPI003217506D
MLGSIKYFILNSFVLRIPSRRIRKFFLKRVLQKIGDGTNFLRFVELRNPKNISVGNHSVINQRVLLDGRGGKLVIGDNVDIAQETNIWTLGHDPNSDYHAAKGGDVVIEDYVWIASRVTILPGVRIGRGVVVAANSVVTKDIPPMSIVAGVPAKVIAKRESQLLYTLNYKPWLR